MALAVSMMNPVQREFLLCKWPSFGLSELLFRLVW